MANSLADTHIRLLLAKFVLAFDFALEDPAWDINDWTDNATKAFKTPMMLKVTVAGPSE